MSNQGIDFDDLVNVVRIKFQEEYSIEVLILALGGSHALGLANQTSDIDMYLIFSISKSAEYKVIPRLSSFFCNDLHIKIDVMCIELEDILRQIEEYKASEHIYPTCLHRNKDEQEKNRGAKDAYRDDFVRGMVFRTILTRYVWSNKKIDKYFKLFKQGLESRDVVDFYFSRAKGNYVHEIQDKKKVLCRKYLYTIHEILYCLWIIESGTVPPMLFCELRNACEDNNVQREIDKLVKQNTSIKNSKEKLLVNANDDLNHFICDNLTKIENEFVRLKGRFLVDE